MSATSFAPTTKPFWETKPLEAMTPAEWESLCDGCGKCCLHKLQEEEEDGSLGVVMHTNVACRLLDLGSCRCKKYPTRFRYVPDCVQLTPDKVHEVTWLPASCAYRLVAEGKPLAWWHPLVSGDPDTVHQAGISVRGRCISETRAGPLEHHIVEWPDL